jgi:hypothetical protein
MQESVLMKIEMLGREKGSRYLFLNWPLISPFWVSLCRAMGIYAMSDGCLVPVRMQELFSWSPLRWSLPVSIITSSICPYHFSFTFPPRWNQFNMQLKDILEGKGGTKTMMYAHKCLTSMFDIEVWFGPFSECSTDNRSEEGSLTLWYDRTLPLTWAELSSALDYSLSQYSFTLEG